MVRRFFRDSAIYVVPSVLASGMSFVMFPLYAHHFTPREYGVFDLLALTAMLVGWTVALQIYQGVGVYVAGERDLAIARSYASTAFWFTVAAYTAFALLIEALASGTSHLLLGPHVAVSLLRVSVPWMCIQGVLALAQAQLRWQLRPIAFAVGAVINFTITVAASAALVFGAHLGVEGAILGQLIGASASLGYVLIATYGTFRFHFNARRCREMLRFSIPLLPSSVGIFLNLYADRLVIQHMRSLYELGLYGVGYRLAMIVSLIVTGFEAAALPLILSRKDEPSTPEDLARIFRIFAALALSAFVVLTVLATPALRILAAPRYQRAAAVVPFLVVAVGFGNMYSFAPGLTIAKRMRPVAVLTVIAGITNLGLALLLVPLLGIIGAGIATAVSSVGWFVALAILSQSHYAVPHRWTELLTSAIAVAALVALALALLPTSRVQAFDPGLVAVRLGVAVVGIALAARLALGNELTSAWQEFTREARKVKLRLRRVPVQDL